MRLVSLDLEFSGFDPDRHEILEIGIAVAEVTESGLQITETWSSLCRPSIQPDPHILQLTGISWDELRSAPALSEVLPQVISLLKDGVVVGHNLNLDRKFLSAAGVTVPRQYIDTMDMVQWILPTHPSYGLEALAHLFGIIDHNAHRALGDALATLQLLQRLVEIFYSFSSGTQQRILAQLNKIFDPTVELLQLSAKVLPLATPPARPPISLSVSLPALKTDMLIFPDLQESIVCAQEYNRELLVGSADQFSAQALESFTVSAKDNDEIYFLIKVLVWLETNWQQHTPLDLNCSFSGRQYLSGICGKNSSNDTVNYPVVTSTKSWAEQNFVQHLNNPPSSVAIFDLARSVREFWRHTQKTVSWSQLLRWTRGFDNLYPGWVTDKKFVEAVGQLDLWGGLIYIWLRRLAMGRTELDWAEVEIQLVWHSRIVRLLQQALNLIQNLPSKYIDSRLESWLKNLQDFLSATDGVRWVSFTEFGLAFHYSPAQVFSNSKWQKFSVSVSGPVYSPEVLEYLTWQIGLAGSEMSTIDIPSAAPEVEIVQRSKQYLVDDVLQWLHSCAEDSHIVVVVASPTQAQKVYQVLTHEPAFNRPVFSEYTGSGTKRLIKQFHKTGGVLILELSTILSNYITVAADYILLTTSMIKPEPSPLISAQADLYPGGADRYYMAQHEYRFVHFRRNLFTERLKSITIAMSDQNSQSEWLNQLFISYPQDKKVVHNAA